MLAYINLLKTYSQARSILHPSIVMHQIKILLTVSNNIHSTIDFASNPPPKSEIPN